MKIVDTTAYVDALREIVLSGAEASVTVAGGSMLPFLCDRRDTVYFSAPDDSVQPLSVGDMVFYLRLQPEERYVLHRIYSCDQDGTYTMVGDAQTVLEHGIRREQIFARVTKARRKGVLIDAEDRVWRFFAHVWIHPWIVPHRRRILSVYTRIKRLFRR